MVTFSDLIHQPRNNIHFKLQEGDMIVMDNLRVLHGRLGYTKPNDNSGGLTRALQGGYWAWDNVRSMRRVLQAKLTPHK
ncbi:hypothetical protein Pcinc_027464 [Petrolisthes cinctipes]|uniref:TauD/TfdA-like domain-containing protein n=1 Tax=Petrolisthes cinctipes TaxID=88211 RepID=A0AAE1F4H3_PETCI|nr:hypothetical protein Pcinc_027464 [Petrolisthes cinctipes]